MLDVAAVVAPRGGEFIGVAEIVVVVGLVSVAGRGGVDAEDADEERAEGGEAGADDGDGGFGGGPNRGGEEVPWVEGWSVVCKRVVGVGQGARTGNVVASVASEED